MVTVGKFLAAIALFLMAVLLKVETEESAEPRSPVHQLIVALAQESHEFDGWLSPILCGLVVALEAIGRWLGPPWAWALVRSTLDSLHADLFGEACEASHEDRITLFKYYAFAPRVCWHPWSGWLIPVARSDHTTRDTRTMFRVGYGGNGAEGVAGRGWSGMIFVPSTGEAPLPPVSADDIEAKAVETYAARTFTSKEWLRKRLKNRTTPMPKSFVGAKILVDNEPWGVLVVDSVKDRIPRDHFMRSFRLVAPTLSGLLDRC